MGRENPVWGEERIANELWLKLGLCVLPRIVRKCLPKRSDDGRRPRVLSQRWRTFVRNHAQVIVACEFCVAVTATFRILYVFVVLEHASRRLLHVNVTAHSTAEWTLQQLRAALPSNHPYRFLIHDGDSIFSPPLDPHICHLGLRILKTPPRSLQAHAHCERLIGTLRRECLNFVIPLTETHLRRLLHKWAAYYYRGRPHRSLGPGIPQPSHLCQCRCASSDTDGRNRITWWRIRFWADGIMTTGLRSRRRDHVAKRGKHRRAIRRGHTLMHVSEQVAKLCQSLLPDKQEAVLDFVAFLVSRQWPTSWTVEQRQEVVRTRGCLRHTRTSREAFAQRKQAEKAREERRWNT